MPPVGNPRRQEPIRVLTMIRDIGLWDGGAERLAVELMRRIDQRRFRPFLCVTRAPTDRRKPLTDAAAAALRQSGVGVLRLERGSSANLLAWRHVYDLMRRERIDVLHCHMFRSNVPGVVLGRLARTPVIIGHEHTWSFEGQALRVFLDREVVARGADAYLAVSREDERRITEIEGIPAEKVRFLPNGIPDLPEPTGRDLRAEFGLPPDAPLVGAVGALRAQKGFDVLVRASALLAREIPNVRVIIVGSGDEDVRVQLVRQITELGLQDNVLLLGLRDDVPDILAALDVAVSSSNFEGSPLAIMEYMAAGSPIVATRVGGVPDLIENGVHGLLVERGDSYGLAQAVLRLLRDRGLGGQLAAAARERQRAEFDIDAMVARVERLYVELYEASSRRR
jgi:glycosyltransferase involved in cell wall biosynthesis